MRGVCLAHSFAVIRLVLRIVYTFVLEVKSVALGVAPDRAGSVDRYFCVISVFGSAIKYMISFVPVCSMFISLLV